MNVFILVILPNIIKYLEITFKEEQTDIQFQNDIILLSWCKFKFYFHQQ